MGRGRASVGRPRSVVPQTGVESRLTSTSRLLCQRSSPLELSFVAPALGVTERCVVLRVEVSSSTSRASMALAGKACQAWWDSEPPTRNRWKMQKRRRPIPSANPTGPNRLANPELFSREHCQSRCEQIMTVSRKACLASRGGLEVWRPRWFRKSKGDGRHLPFHIPSAPSSDIPVISRTFRGNDRHPVDVRVLLRPNLLGCHHPFAADAIPAMTPHQGISRSCQRRSKLALPRPTKSM